jgi:hypothetical protein
VGKRSRQFPIPVTENERGAARGRRTPRRRRSSLIMSHKDRERIFIETLNACGLLDRGEALKSQALIF